MPISDDDRRRVERMVQERTRRETKDREDRQRRIDEQRRRDNDKKNK